MALPPEAPCIAIVTFCTHRRTAHRMADASVHGDAGNAVIGCAIRSRQNKPCQNIEEPVTISECTRYRRQCHSFMTPLLPQGALGGTGEGP